MIHNHDAAAAAAAAPDDDDDDDDDEKVSSPALLRVFSGTSKQMLQFQYSKVKSPTGGKWSRN